MVSGRGEGIVVVVIIIQSIIVFGGEMRVLQ